MDKLPQATLALDDAIGHILLAAKRGQPADELNGIDIMGDDNQLGGLVFYQSCDVIQAVLEYHRLLGFCLLSRFLLLSHLHETVLLGLACFWHVLLAQLEHMSCLVLVNSAVELVDGWGHFEPHEHDL